MSHSPAGPVVISGSAAEELTSVSSLSLVIPTTPESIWAKYIRKTRPLGPRFIKPNGTSLSFYPYPQSCWRRSTASFRVASHLSLQSHERRSDDDALS